MIGFLWFFLGWWNVLCQFLQNNEWSKAPHLLTARVAAISSNSRQEEGVRSPGTVKKSVQIPGGREEGRWEVRLAQWPAPCLTSYKDCIPTAPPAPPPSLTAPLAPPPSLTAPTAPPPPSYSSSLPFITPFLPKICFQTRRGVWHESKNQGMLCEEPLLWPFW